ncbi:MAG: hypothetical protein ICV63_00470 [Coleofasciculus sp. Co-bin14]|nr:hypothetical protein [Coleofasciculus sp. Co-bin14]
MGRKRTTGATTCVVRLPLRHKEKVLEIIQHLKQSEVSQEATKQTETPVALGIIQILIERMGLIDLCQLCQFYEIPCTDEWGRFLEKKILRAILIEFLGDKIR